jgi:phosphoribosyl-dephospho-CoA transferase
MTPLRRHQLVWLDEFAWFRVLASASASSHSLQPSELQTHKMECLEHWAQQRWPLVVTRQAEPRSEHDPNAALALGLSAPARWGRQAICVSTTLGGVMRRGSFPSAAEVGDTLPPAALRNWLALCQSLSQLGVVAGVYGSHGWQQLTGLGYVHANSDIDMLLGVVTPAQADQACALMSSAELGSVRIDGELAFANGASVSWREWMMFRSRQADRILVKHLTRTSMEDSLSWVAGA